MYKYSALTFALLTSLFGDVTMCYKENIASPSKVETTPLDGGECKSKYSVTDMKNSGWIIKDIIATKSDSGLNYTYTFSKVTTTSNTISQENLQAQLILLDKQKELQVKEDKETKSILDGKKTYEKQCASCHGFKGELEPHTSSKLIGMSSEDFDDSMRAYNLRDKDKGAAILMNTYTLMSGERKDVIKYLESIDVLIKPVKK